MKLVIDLDGTLTIDIPGPYSDKKPNLEVVKKLREYREYGFTICIHTARSMRTYNGNIGRINIHTLPEIISWLNKHDVTYDEIILGKPWCEAEGFYVDDRAVRPSEFVKLSFSEIKEILENEREKLKKCS